VTRRRQPTLEEQAVLRRIGRLKAGDGQRVGLRDLGAMCPDCDRNLRVAQRDTDEFLATGQLGDPVHFECARGHRHTRTRRELEARAKAAQDAGIHRFTL
jgi:hypothetical protein